MGIYSTIIKCQFSFSGCWKPAEIPKHPERIAFQLKPASEGRSQNLFLAKAQQCA